MIIRICNVQKMQIAFSNFIDFKILVMNNPFVLIHTAHSSRLRFASSRCMLSPNTTINKQRSPSVTAVYLFVLGSLSLVLYSTCRLWCKVIKHSVYALDLSCDSFYEMFHKLKRYILYFCCHRICCIDRTYDNRPFK